MKRSVRENARKHAAKIIGALEKDIEYNSNEDLSDFLSALSDILNADLSDWADDVNEY